ncbi:MAG: 5-(carboxyamino)imidazole ribonucleotide mutase [Spirochaetales bacterium]
MSETPRVGIIMGSENDLQTMEAAAQVLEELSVAHEVTIVSAHRTPDRMVGYAKQARERGLRCIVAGAGGAAHLPGMVAAMTSLPVIGVPIRGSNLEGLDSLLSIVQMPRGVPVATVAINNSTNAALLAARILAAGSDEESRALAVRLDARAEETRNSVENGARELERLGVGAFLAR